MPILINYNTLIYSIWLTLINYETFFKGFIKMGKGLKKLLKRIYTKNSACKKNDCL